MYYSLRENNNFYALLFFNLVLFVLTLWQFFTRNTTQTLPSLFELGDPNYALPSLLLGLFIITGIISSYTIYVSFRRSIELLSEGELNNGLVSMLAAFLLITALFIVGEMVLNKFSVLFIVGGLIAGYMYLNNRR